MPKPQEIDCTVKNFAPKQSALLITIGDWKISIDKNYKNETIVNVIDSKEGSETRYTLGKEGETQFI